MEPERIVKELIKWIENHKQECTDPECFEPYNIVAFLAHCAGVRLENLSKFTAELVTYERDCEDCQHTRN